MPDGWRHVTKRNPDALRWAAAALSGPRATCLACFRDLCRFSQSSERVNARHRLAATEKMACSLARCLSFEGDGANLHLLRARPELAPPEAGAGATPPPPPPPADPRRRRLAELQQFVARLTSGGAVESSLGLPGFLALVDSEHQRLQGELARDRGGLGGWAVVGQVWIVSEALLSRTHLTV